MTSTKLKIIALIFMLIDHIGAFIPGMPIYLHWIGRLSAPIFIFCTVWGLEFTKSKTRYLVRLYLASLVMAIIQYFLQIDNNFFRTLFSIGILIFLIDSYKENKNLKYIGIYLLWQSVSITICILSFKITWLSTDFCAVILPTFLGSVFYLEGGLVFVTLGVLFYLTKRNKKAFISCYTLFCALYLLITVSPILPVLIGKLRYYNLGFISDVVTYTFDVIIRISPMSTGGSFLFQNYQWMLIGALPFMLAYNKKPGKKLKYLFYIFYPLHIIILFYIEKLI